MKALSIAGFHRSGTSLVAQILHDAGLFLGDDLIGANESNPYGHFEDREFVTFHDLLLADNGHTWQVSRPFVPVVREARWEATADIVRRRSTSHAQWGFKDPRACLFLNIWKQLIPDLKVLLVYRHFSACVYSLERRHAAEYFDQRGNRRIHLGFWEEPDLALRMWLLSNRALLAFATSYPEDTEVVSFSQVAAGHDPTRPLRERWGFDLRSGAPREIFDPSVTTDRPSPQVVFDRDLIDELRETWESLESMSRMEAST